MTTSMNYGVLKELINDRVENQKALADSLGISLTSLGNKLNNRAPFTHEEMIKISVTLNLSDLEIARCFFITK